MCHAPPGRALRFTFADLCNLPLGAADYLALTERLPYPVPLLSFSVLTPNRRNEARRFMTLVDALYERRMMLFISAEAPGLIAQPSAVTVPSSSSGRSADCFEMQSCGDWLEACRRRRPEELPNTFAP